MIKKLSAALVGATFVLAGCNTMSGMGQDIKAGGEKLEKKADDVKHGSSENASKHEHGAMRHEHGTMNHEHGTMNHEHGTMNHEHGSMEGSSMNGSTPSQPTETMTNEGTGTSSDSSMWDKTKEKASEIKNSVKDKFSK